jgi:hypothetical protein
VCGVVDLSNKEAPNAGLFIGSFIWLKLQSWLLWFATGLAPLIAKWCRESAALKKDCALLADDLGEDADFARSVAASQLLAVGRKHQIICPPKDATAPEGNSVSTKYREFTEAMPDCAGTPTVKTVMAWDVKMTDANDPDKHVYSLKRIDYIILLLGLCYLICWCFGVANTQFEPRGGVFNAYIIQGELFNEPLGGFDRGGPPPGEGSGDHGGGDDDERDKCHRDCDDDDDKCQCKCDDDDKCNDQ